MDEIRELRVHGVSGTPPRDILHTDPVPEMGADKFARIFRKRPSLEITHPSGRPYETEAFHWGSLTTGHWLTSLWVLLTPFALANVAGWMAVRRSPLQRSVIRLAGLALTGLFVVQLGYVVVAAPAIFADANTWSETARFWLRAGSGLAFVLAFGALVLRLSIQSHFDPLTYRRRLRLLFSPKIAHMCQEEDETPDWSDPGAARVDDETVWGVHTILHRLRRIHFAAGQLIIALVLARIADSGPVKVAAIVGLATAAALILATSYVPANRLVLAATAWSTIIAEACAILAVASYAISSHLDVAAVHRTTFHVAIALGVAGAISVLAGIPGVGALTLATFFGGALGVGAGFIVEDLLGIEDNLVDQGGAWVAPASLIFVLFLGLVGVLFTFTGEPSLRAEGLTNRLVTRFTRKSRLFLAAAAAFGLVFGGWAIVEGCLLTPGLCQPDALSEIPWANAIVVALLVLIIGLFGFRLVGFNRVAGAGTLAGAALVLWIGVAEPSFGPVTPSNYLEALPLSRTLIFIAPVLAIGRSVLGAYRQGASNRKVGVLWDIASFWPRWFHPLAPPAYGPKVVSALRDEIADGGVDVLAGHSQGSVIAAVATHQAIGLGEGLPAGLLTYGSPIGLLYRKLFPDAGIDDLTATLPDSLMRGWTNILREDDPIGGDALGGAVDDVVDSDGSGHSGYELGRAFREARDRLV